MIIPQPSDAGVKYDGGGESAPGLRGKLWSSGLCLCFQFRWFRGSSETGLIYVGVRLVALCQSQSLRVFLPKPPAEPFRNLDERPRQREDYPN